MGEWLLVLSAVLLTVGTSVFVAAEFSLVALERSTVEEAVAVGRPRAQIVLRSLRSLSTQLSAAQVGITLTTLAVGFLAQPAVGSLLMAPLAAWLPADAVEPAATTLALVLVTVFSMVLGELLPQFLGISAPMRTAAIVASPVRAFAILARPLIAVLNGSANTVLRVVGITPREELSAARTPQELASLVRRSAEVGTLAPATAAMLTRSLDFAERTAADVMTPRVRCVAVERTDTSEEILRLSRRTGHSRFPVIGADWDDVDGIVHVKAAMAVPVGRRAEVPASALMVAHVVVPETIRLAPLLQQLRAAGLQLALVVDEYGGTSGVVTLEDVVEEIVGEVSDEHDRSRSTGRQLPDGSWSVSGMWRPDEVRDRIGAPVPEGPAYESLGGFVMAALGRMPASGDQVAVPGWDLEVTRLEGRRVARVRLRPRRGPEDAQSGPGGVPGRGVPGGMPGKGRE
ncbi:MAG: hemolysin family protein [Dermatophilaceae bacterium]